MTTLYFLLKLERFPDVIACQAFVNCVRILYGLKKFLDKLGEKSPSSDTNSNMDSPVTISWTAYYKKKRDEKWLTWLHEYVFLDFRNDSSSVKRFQSFQYFCNEGLIPFVNEHKYSLNPNYDLANELANFLYKGQDEFQRSQSFYREQNIKAKHDLDYDYYILRGIPNDSWDAFWDKWQWMTDFYDEKFRNRYLIPKFVYDRLHLEISGATEVLTREIEADEAADDYHQYVDQASEAIGHGKDKNSLY